MSFREGKRLLATTVATLASALLIALNTKVGLGLSEATITTLAANIGAVVSLYIWGQTRTDQSEGEPEGDE